MEEFVIGGTADISREGLRSRMENIRREMMEGLRLKGHMGDF